MATELYSIFETAGGVCGIAWTDKGVARFQLPTKSDEATERLLRRRLSPDAVASVPTPEIDRIISDVRRYFEGSAIDFGQIDLDLGPQDEFFQQIYENVRRLAWGETTTYGRMARQLGAGPEAARTVGEAMARNPVPLIIPCHRVLAAGGKIGGFSAPGGAASKARMLELEGIHLTPPEPQQSFGF